MKNLNYIFLFLFFLTSNTFSQTASNASNSQSLELKVSSLEQSYDSQVYLLLSNYFDRKKFFVDVNINAEFIDETVETTQNRVIQNRPDNVTMPGLPFLPQENLRANTSTQTPETVVNQSSIRTLRLININISIYADTSFSPQEIQFMSLLTEIAAKTNDARGDEVTIAQIPIPTIGTVDPIQVIQSPPEQESILASFRSYIPGFVLLILFGAIMFLSRFFNKPEERSSQLQQRESIKHDISISDFGRPSEQVIVNNSEGRDISIEIDELINNFFNKSQEIALLFEYWLDENKEEGSLKAAEVIASVDKQLLRAIKNDLQPENLESINAALETLAPMMSERKSSVIRSFNSVLKTGNKTNLSSKKNGHINLFKFLDHISDAQIVDLLNDEGYQTGALIIDYLPDDKAAKVLDRIDKVRSANIMLKMTTISSIPYQLQSEISSKLFDKAMDLKDQEKEQRLGAENILPVLDKLPLNEQQAYIDQLKATNSVVGEVVERQFITINQVLTLTDDIIKEAIVDVNTSTLLDAVIGLDQKLVDKFLSVRPKREQRLIRLELDGLKDRPVKDTNEAKSEVMKRIRKTVQKNKSLS
tara:strand:- start:19681 stop:21447 length:1767 start_codon:yes stop_codon:yes gene_type:complete